MQTIRHAIIELVQNQVWAILPEYLEIINEILYAKFYSGKPSDQRVADAISRLGGPVMLAGGQSADAPPFTTKDGVAIVPVVGTIAKRMNMFSDISGGTSAELLRRNVSLALNDPNVKAIITQYDSPGGVASGIQSLSDFLYEARNQKPIVTHADGLMASAALWLGTAGSKVYASSESDQIGSIGVLTSHTDLSKAYENAGMKKTYLYAGKYKAVGNEAQPLSQEDEAVIMDRLMKTYNIFIESVAKNRGVSAEQVRNDMADARMFMASDAVNVGLIDGIKTLDETIHEASLMAGPTYSLGAQATSEGGVDSLESAHTKEEEMDEKLMKEYEDKIEALKGDLSAKDQTIGELTAANKALEKELTLTKAAAQAEKDQAKAESIVTEALSKTSIPEAFHAKVKGMVLYSSFKTEAGLFDADAFATAFAAEVKDWEEKLPAGASTITLVTDSKEDKTTTTIQFAAENKEILKGLV